MSETAGLKRATLADLGQRLPHGVDNAGSECLQSFTFKPSVARTAVAIGEAKNKPESRGFPGQVAVNVILAFCEEVAGRKLGTMAPREAQAFLASMTTVDVQHLLYSWAASRKMPAVATGTASCPVCSTLIPDGSRLSLGEMGVFYREPWGERPMTELDLGDEVEINRLGRIRKLWVKVPTWKAVYYDLTARDLENEATVQVAFAEGGICGTNLKSPKTFAAPPKGYLLDLPSDLLELIAGSVVEFSGGPTGIVPLKCRREGCEGALPVPFFWATSGLF